MANIFFLINTKYNAKNMNEMKNVRALNIPAKIMIAAVSQYNILYLLI